MPRYNIACSECSYKGREIICSYATIKRHRCPECGASTVLEMSTATLRGLPTPRFHGKVPKHKDKGFKEELKSIYKDDPLGVPGGDDDT